MGALMTAHRLPLPRRRWPAAAGAVTIAVVAACALSACGRTNQYAAPPRAKVTVAVPIARDVTGYFESTGNTAAVNSVDLVARVQGFVQAISYKDGDLVKKGTSLFTIEPEPYRLKVDAAKASVNGAQASLAQRDSARANLQSAQANEKQAEITYDYTNVAAPFDGVVSARQVSIGELVGAATTPTVLSTIVQLDPIWVNFNVSEADVLRVRADLKKQGRTTADVIGMAVEIGTQTESSFPHSGKLDYVAPTVDATTGTLAARAVLPNADRALLPGLFVKVRIPLRPRPALLVPDVAIGANQAGRYVLVVNKDDVVEQRKVEVGQPVGELRVIDSGLTKDDRVVVGGIVRAIPGQKVDAEPAPAAAAGR